MSDIYAMGAQPLFALNIVGFPSKKLSMDVLAEILKGGAAKAAEAGISVIGGHTIEDPEPKYGMVVTAVINPAQVVTNAGANAGDILVLTKPLNPGVVPGGTRKNLEFLKEDLIINSGITDVDLLVLADAQTSGGLLISVTEDKLQSLLQELKEIGVQTISIVGKMVQDDLFRLEISK